MPPEYGKPPHAPSPAHVPLTPAEKHGIFVRAPGITAQDTVNPPPHRYFHSSCPPTPYPPASPSRTRHPSSNCPAIASRALCLCAPAMMSLICCFRGKSHSPLQYNYASCPIPLPVQISLHALSPESSRARRSHTLSIFAARCAASFKQICIVCFSPPDFIQNFLIFFSTLKTCTFCVPGCP